MFKRLKSKIRYEIFKMIRSCVNHALGSYEFKEGMARYYASAVGVDKMREFLAEADKFRAENGYYNYTSLADMFARNQRYWLDKE